MKKNLLLLFIFFHAFAVASHAQQTGARKSNFDLKARIDSILQGEVDADKIPGAVIQVKKDGKIIYTSAYGYAQKYDYHHQLINPLEKMTTEYLFDIASLTKVVGTTTSIMLLADRGLLKVDDPVGKYIQSFNTPDKSSITIRHLLTHSAGLYEWYPLYYKCSNKEETYKLIGELPLKYPVGAQRKYSDLGFVILGEIIEHVSGVSLEQFMENNIFIPLHMEHTAFNPLQKGKFKKIAATSHGNPYENRMVHDSSLGFTVKDIDPDQWNKWRNYTLRGEVNDGNAWYANGGISGAAGLFSTVADLQKLVDMLMNKGRVHSNQFISGKTIESFLIQDKFKNGLGWMMDPGNSFMNNAPAESFGHTGFTGTSIVAVPKWGVTIVLLINRQNMGLSSSREYYNVGPIRKEIFEVVKESLGK
ncbi:MAG: serine hydrolase [Bacteroidetes bacterium]|nr:serine hydrolase [Bacteroidota bacterium]